jgi:hypothetical protein
MAVRMSSVQSCPALERENCELYCQLLQQKVDLKITWLWFMSKTVMSRRHGNWQKSTDFALV